MADCKDIDAALARLTSKIDGMNGRLNNLEREQKRCCDNKQGQNKNVDLAPLIKRIAAIERYINTLDNEIKLITNKIKEIAAFLKDLGNTADGILNKVVGSINLFGNLFKFFK